MKFTVRDRNIKLNLVCLMIHVVCWIFAASFPPVQSPLHDFLIVCCCFFFIPLNFHANIFHRFGKREMLNEEIN